MKKDKTGGAAFPHVSTHMDRTGMTLRDYFAGQVIGNLEMFAPNTRVFAYLDEDAALAYRVADAMIAEREKGGE